MMRRSRLPLFPLVVALAFVVTACSASTMRFAAKGGEYTAEDVASVAEEVDRPPSLGASVDDADDLRQEALVDLRRQGGLAADLADLLTSEFPGPARSVPFYGEAARFEGADAWIVLEVWGSPGETLEMSRLWVFERESGQVLYSASVPAPLD